MFGLELVKSLCFKKKILKLKICRRLWFQTLSWPKLPIGYLSHSLFPRWHSSAMASKLLFLPNSFFSRPALAAERPRYSRRKNASPTVTSSTASTNANPFPQYSPMPLYNQRGKAPMWPPNRPNQLSSSVAVRSSLSYPIISPQDQWGMWTALFSVGAFGIW